MEQSEKITIVIVSDNHLVKMLGCLLMSLENTHRGDTNVEIYIINDKISRRNIEKINLMIAPFRIKIIWKDLADVIPADIELPRDNTSYPRCAYARICAPFFLPSDIKKVIYLDVDMLVKRDIEGLWNIDIGTHTIAAVQDRFQIVSSPWGGIKNYKELGLDPLTKYFNSGLLVINLEKWRMMGATELIISTIQNNQNYVTYADQYGFNIVFANAWFELDARWNNFALNTNTDPYIIHFTGVKPLFKGYCSNPEYKEIFYKTLKSTPWKHYKPKDNYIWKFKKLRNMISKKSWDSIVNKFLQSTLGV